MISTIRGESNCHLRCGPFDCAQGSWAKAFTSVDADNRVTFATRIAGQFLWGQLAPRRSRMLFFLFWTGLGGTFLGAGSSFAF